MYGYQPEDLLYYLTLYNEPYLQPEMPSGIEEGIVAGLYRYREGPKNSSYQADVLASGTAILSALEAQRELIERFDVSAQIWSATSYKALRDDALSAERWNRLHPGEPPRTPYIQRVLGERDGPVIAVTDHLKLVPDQIGRFVPGPFVPLGTDGFGLSDTRAELRRHFEIDAAHIVTAVLWGLFVKGEIEAEMVLEANRSYRIETEAPDPRDA